MKKICGRKNRCALQANQQQVECIADMVINNLWPVLIAVQDARQITSEYLPTGFLDNVAEKTEKVLGWAMALRMPDSPMEHRVCNETLPVILAPDRVLI